MAKPFDDNASLEKNVALKSVEELLLLVSDEDQGCKPEAIDRMMSMGLAANYGFLEKAVRNDADADLRNGAMEVFVRFGNESVPRLLSLLQDENEEIRNFSAVMLGDIASRDAVDGLIKALRDQDANVRHAAAEALGKIGDRAALLPLMALLKEDFWQQYPAIVALGEMCDSRAVHGLLQLLGDEMLREPVIEALGKIGDSRALLPLAKILSEPAGTYAAATAKAIAAIQKNLVAVRSRNGRNVNTLPTLPEGIISQQGIKNLKGLLTAGNNSDVCFAAVMLLGSLKEKSAIPVFFQLLEIGDYLDVVVEAMVEIGNAGVPAVMAGLSLSHDNVRIASLRSLRMLGGDVSVAVLLPILLAGSGTVQFEALEFMRGTTDTALLPAVTELLGTAAPPVKFKLLEVLSCYPVPEVKPIMCRLLDSSDADKKEAAAILIGLEGTGAFVDSLPSLVCDKDARVRREAIKAAARQGCHQTIPLLLTALTDEIADVRDEAVMALAGYGKAAPVSDLLHFLGQGDEQLDYTIIKALAKAESADAENALVEYLQKSDVSQHLEFAVIEALGKLSCSAGSGRRVVTAYLSHNDPDIRRLALQALASLAGLDALAELSAACDDRHWSVRVAALQALGKMGGDLIVPHISAALTDKDDMVRKNAILALGESGSSFAVPELVKQLTDTVMGKFAAEGIVSIGRAGLPRLHWIIKGDYPAELREMVIDLLGKIGDNRSVNILLNLLEDPSSAIRLAAIDALVFCYDSAPLKKLAHIKRCDEDDQVKVKAALALKSFTTDKFQ